MKGLVVDHWPLGLSVGSEPVGHTRRTRRVRPAQLL